MKASTPAVVPATSVAAANGDEALGSLAWPKAAPEATGKDSPLYRYLPALDGLRAVSILWVLSVHWPGTLALSQLGIVKRGAFGVEIFFAISGLLVTRSLQQCVVRAARAHGGKLAIFRDFIVRRVARIWPPYFVALLVGFGGMFVDPALRANWVNNKATAWSFPAFLANYTIPNHGAPLSLLVMWSLCFEEQFYIVLIALYLLGPKQLTKFIAGAALASIALRIVCTRLFPEQFSIFSLQMEPHWRIDAIAWGCLAWIYHRELFGFWERTKHRALLQNLALVAAVLVCCFNPEDIATRAVWYVLLALAFAGLVGALSFSPDFWLGRLLAWRPLVFVGEVSYEVYLSHITVYRVLTRIGLERFPALYYVLTFACAIFAGWVFHRVFSKPTQRILRRWLDHLPT